MKTTKKKSFKRLFAFLMAFVMVTALAANAVFAAGSFTDVSEGDDFYENIESLYEQGIIGGFADGTFRPGDYLTRQQAAKMIALGSGYGEHDGTGSKLVDVADLTWGQENIWALEAAGVVKGFGTSKEFRPRLNITRGHVAKMIAKAFGLEEGAEEVDLIDLPADEEVAEAIRVLASNGIVKGFGTSKEFRPDALVTRGQFAKMVDLAIKAADARVLYVRALDGVTIEIRFSQPVDESSAVAIGWGNKVKIDGVHIRSRALSDDGRVLTLAVRMGNYNGPAIDVTNATVEVEPVRLEGSTTLRTVRYVGKLTYKDTKAPEVVDVKAEDKKAEITFDEPLRRISGVSLDGVNLARNTDYDFSGKVLTLNNLENGKTYTVEIVGAEDRAGNIADPIERTFTVLEPGEDPDQDVTISAAGNKVTLVFVNAVDGEKVDFEPKAGGDTIVLNRSAATPGIEYSKDGKTVTVDAQLYGVLGALNYLETKVTVSGLGTSVDDVEKTVTLIADKVAPQFVSSEAKTDTSGVMTLQLNFDKEVADPTTTCDLIITHKDGVVQSPPNGISVSGLTVGRALDDDDEKIPTALVVTLGTDFKQKESYTVEFAEGTFKDVYGNLVDKFTTSFTIPEKGDEPAADPGAVITVTTNVEGSKITLTFNAPGNLTDASAVAANFKLGGKALPAGSTVQFVGTKKIIQITLPAGSIVTKGKYRLTLANIADANGNTLKAGQEEKYVNLDENVPPTVVSVATTQSDEIVVTFSENVTGTLTGVTLKVNGEAVVPAASSAVTDNKLTLNLEAADALELGDAISIEFKDSDIADTVGNKLADVTVTK